jgi:hypothetical protein
MQNRPRCTWKDQNFLQSASGLGLKPSSKAGVMLEELLGIPVAAALYVPLPRLL